MKIQSVRVDDQVIQGSLRVVTCQPVELEAYEPARPSAGKVLLSGLGAGAATRYAWQGFEASNTLGTDEITKLLVKNGVSQQHAPAVANKALEVIRAEPTKMLLVAVSAGGASWAALEFTGNVFGFHVAALRKLIVSLIVAAAAALGYYLLRSRGYLE
jgi:hypothetical protein